MASRTPTAGLYTAAFVWNLFWGVPLLLVPDMATTSLGLGAPSPGVGELHARAGGLAVLLFGWVYLTVGRDPAAFRPFLLISIVAKLAFFIVVAVVYVRHRELLAMLVIAVGDLLFGALFLRDWRALR